MEEIYKSLEKLGYSGPKICTTGESQVSGEMGRLDQNLSDLVELVKRLEIRLAPLLRDDAGSPSGPSSANGAILVPHAAEIRCAWNKVEEITGHLRSVCDRLEL